MRSGIIIVCCICFFIPPAVADGIGPGAAIPAVAGLPGLNGTYWQSDVVIQNPGDIATSVRFLLFPEIRNGAQTFEPITSDPFSIPAHGQLTKTNIVQSVFGLFNVKGGLSVISEDGTTIVVGSRTYTYASDGGSYGQDVSGVLSKDRAWVGGVENDSLYRSNIGIYLPISPASGQSLSFEIRLYDEGGNFIAGDTVDFPFAGLIQRTVSSFCEDQIPAASVELICSDPDAVWYAYLSRVDQISGDAVYRPLRGTNLQ